MAETTTYPVQTPGAVLRRASETPPVRTDPSRSARAGRDGLTALLFLSPTLLLVSVFIVFPIVFSFYLSFHEWNMFTAEQAFVGLDNYRRMFESAEFWKVFKNTIIYTVATVPVNMALALAVAIALNKKLVGKKFLRAAFFTPVIISSVAAAVIWRWIFDPNLGVLNHVLQTVGIPAVNWMSDPTAAMSALIIVGIWKTFGVNMVLFDAGLGAIPEAYYEASEIDGAGAWVKFRSVTVPLLAPTTFFVLILSLIGSFQVFDLVYVLTQGGPLGETKVLVFLLYEQAFQFFNMGYASAIAYVLFAVLIVLTLAQIRFFRRQLSNAV